MSKTFEVVPFHDHEILAVREGDDVIVPLKPMVEGIGLAWQGQLERVKRHPVLSQGIRVTLIPSQGGMQESVCLTLEMVPGYLATIQSERIKDEAIRNRVVLFQREAFQVLFHHFFKRGGRGQRDALGGTSTTGEILRLVDRLKDEDQPEIKAMLYAMLEQTCNRMSLPLPAIDAFGKPRPVIAEEFFAALADLRDHGVIIDLHRDPTLLAVPLKKVEWAATRHGIKCARGQPLWAALRAHVAFEMAGAVNCRDGKSRHCWVFRRDKLPVEFPAPQ